jgi:hypothetical protein
MQKPTNATELLRLIDQAADEQWEELDLSGLGLGELPKAIGQLTIGYFDEPRNNNTSTKYEQHRTCSARKTGTA